jgi:hypothetical protein
LDIALVLEQLDDAKQLVRRDGDSSKSEESLSKGVTDDSQALPPHPRLRRAAAHWSGGRFLHLD